MRWLGLVALIVVAGCDAGPSAVMHDGDGKSPTGAAPGPVAQAQAPGDIEEASMPIVGQAQSKTTVASTPLKTPAGSAAISETRYGDWPLWSTSKKYPAVDNARYQFQKHGAEVGAKSYEDFLAMVHGFIHTPPKGTQTLKRRNGDTLLYDPKQNIFAVATRAGAPRIFFRPDNGAAYWDQQKQLEAAGGARESGND